MTEVVPPWTGRFAGSVTGSSKRWSVADREDHPAERPPCGRGCDAVPSPASDVYSLASPAGCPRNTGETTPPEPGVRRSAGKLTELLVFL